MRYLKNLELFLESTKSNTNLITDICIAMLLINPDFLNSILDKGMHTRYKYNNLVFINDLKQLLMKENRLILGKKNEETGRYEEEDNIGKINSYFNDHSKEFNIEKDFKKLEKARNIARNIQDKLLVEDKLRAEMVQKVYWISPNKERGIKEDIVIELVGSKQYPIVVNSNINSSKTKSFNTLLDVMLDSDADILFSDKYIDLWDKLTVNWFNAVYKNAKTDYKIMIDQFIDASRADSLTFFDYQNIEILDEKYKILGQFFAPLNKNYKELPKLMNDIWKDRKKSINNYQEVEKEWDETKKVLLNNRIIEDIIIGSIEELIEGEIKKDENKFIIANNKIKSRLLRLILDIISVEDIDVYYAGSSSFYHLPSKKWFRDNYNRLTVKYDYHQELSDDNDSQFDIRIELDEKPLMDLEIRTGFTSNEMGNKLSSKIKINYTSNFNQKVKQ